ncbi:MAG: OmpH family outer membrane protein [Fimbriimonadaceae bacterium]|nr:OmpH family outer membrane protein [Chitinophagales bacterium]
MKKITLLIITICLSSLLFSQTVKIGYINSLELVSLMPETKAADDQLMVLAQQLDAQYKEYIIEYQKQATILQNDTTLSQIAYEAKVQDLQSLEKRIQDYEKSSQDKVNQKKTELYQPVLDKATQAVKDVAKENGYTHVLDSSTGAIVYAPDGDNILELVKKKLNIQ